jgi:hypothetical protein
MMPKPSSESTRAVIRSDQTATAERIRRLERYMTTRVLTRSREFVCRYYAECLGSIRPGDWFREGLLSHVGRHYDLSMQGVPLRVMVVGQEYGMHAPQGGQEVRRRVTLCERYQMIHDGTGLGARYYRSGSYPGRNPHMRGTTSALRILFGRGLGADWEDEFVRTADGERFHVFDGFALVNALLCSAGPPSSSQGRSSFVMRRNCLEHFSATLEVLKPTVIVLQGGGVRRWMAPILLTEHRQSAYLVEATYPGGRAFVCQLSHPSARGANRWGDRLDSPYLNEVVEPTLTSALSLLRERGLT